MTKPNILIFMTDQQRAQSVFPEHPAKTPYLDAFHKEGLLFDNARCPSPHCCPSRATFFTGLYPSEHGVWNNVEVLNTLSTGLKDDVKLWSNDLAEAGYAMSFQGKWHVDKFQKPDKFSWKVEQVESPATNAPASKYATYNKSIEGNWALRKEQASQGVNKEDLERPYASVLRPGYETYTHFGPHEDPFNDLNVVKRGVQSIKELSQGEKPWCCYVGTLGPHDPYIVPQRFIDMYKDVEVELPESFHDDLIDKPGLYRRTQARFNQLTEEEHKDAILHYWAFCTYEDYLFGQLLKELEASDQKENTLVIYCSDHGDYVADHGLWCKGLPSFTGCYEIPFSVRWPAGVKNPGRRISAKIGLEDSARTLLQSAGLSETAENWPGSGRDLTPFFNDDENIPWREAWATQSNGNELYGIQRSWDNGRWRLVYNGFDEDELYDLEADPHQMKNVAKDPTYREQLRECYNHLWAFAYEHKDVCINKYIMTALADFGPAVAFSDSGKEIASLA